jgi:hypothetical protein
MNQIEINNTMHRILCFILLMLCIGYSRAQEPEARKVIPAKGDGRAVPAEVMNHIYDIIKTPFKYGVVLKGVTPGQKVDSAAQFFFCKIV